MYLLNVSLFDLFYTNINKKCNYFKTLKLSEIPGLPFFIFMSIETQVN